MMPTDPRRWPPPGQPEWDPTDYVRDCSWLGQPREGFERRRRLTVREWFRADRAAMWRGASPVHPAHDAAAQIDLLARLIVEMNNPKDEPHRLADDGRIVSLRGAWIWLDPCTSRAVAEENCRAVLGELLWLAWPVADREKYDWTYRMITRSGDGPRW